MEFEEVDNVQRIRPDENSPLLAGLLNGKTYRVTNWKGSSTLYKAARNNGKRFRTRRDDATHWIVWMEEPKAEPDITPLRPVEDAEGATKKS